VHGLSQFPYFSPRHDNRALALGDTGVATPAILRTLYNITDAVSPVGATNSTQAAAGWEHESYSGGDLEHFQDHFKLAKNPVRLEYGFNTDIPHMESNLDTQTLTGVAQGVPTDFWLNKGIASFDVLDWLLGVGNLTTPPLVWSVSYGEDLDQVTVAYAQQCDQEMQKLATRGVSVLVASGDTGAKSRQAPGFAPEFPAVLPSCTAVGATTLNANLTETSAVSCTAGWCTGGGFSFPAYFPNTTAPWQQAAASQYWRTAQLPPATDYEKEVGGVGFPDVAAIGSAHTISYFGLLTSVMGTSASCPTMAGAVSLLNHVRLSAGKSSLGFLNPLFYAHPEAFHDITIGYTGWWAAPGWDPLTGLGSPKYDVLREIVLALP
jgi:tripeptidyl-peptidase-1